MGDPNDNKQPFRLLGLMIIVFLGVLIVLGSGGGDSYVDEDPNIGWIEISSSYIRLVDGQPYTNLVGQPSSMPHILHINALDYVAFSAFMTTLILVLMFRG